MVETKNDRPPAQDADDRIRWFGVFQSPERERQYRRDDLPESIKLVRILAVIVVAAFLAFLVNDYRFFGPTAMMGWMLAVRGLVVAGVVAALWFIRPGMSTARFDGIVITWTMAAKLATLVTAATRPVGFVGDAIVLVLSVILTYWIVPVPLVWRAVTAWFLTGGAIVLGIWVSPWPDASTATAVMLSLVLANLLGGEMSREQQILRRRQFLALSQQQELSARLERAFGEIRTLSGILPICMHCKRIADDSGRWEPVEMYVRRHSHAEFTHGLCPECAQSQYPEIDWDTIRRQRGVKIPPGPPAS